jgi:uncharacterized protein YuzE
LRTDDFRLTYDIHADALAIELPSSRRKFQRYTRELAPGVYGDFDRSGKYLVGIEVLWASQHYRRGALERLPTGVEYITLEEAAAEERMKPAVLRKSIKAGALPAVQRGRTWLVARHELWNWLEARRATPIKNT